MGYLDLLIVGVRLVLLSISLMGLIRFGPYLWGSLTLVRPCVARRLKSHREAALYMRRGSWAIVSSTGVLFTVEFFDRLHFTQLPDQVVKTVYLAAMIGFTLALVLALVASTIEDWRDEHAALPKGPAAPTRLLWAYGVFVLAVGVLGLVLFHI